MAAHNIDSLLGFLAELDQEIGDASSSHGILRKDLAAMLGYKSGSGLSNTIRRGTIRMGELMQIAQKTDTVTLELWPEGIREYLKDQTMFKIFSWCELMRASDEMREAFCAHRNKGGGR